MCVVKPGVSDKTLGEVVFQCDRLEYPSESLKVPVIVPSSSLDHSLSLERRESSSIQKRKSTILNQ
jgi:hypothetical protein